MGKSPGKWIKTVLFGKKSSKSHLSKDATTQKKTSVTAKAPPKDFSDDSMVISSPVPPVMRSSGECTELEKTPSVNLMSDAIEVERSTMALNSVNEDELIRLEQAAIIAQAAFRGYLARRAFWALKGIIRLQAQVRGHLVRRQAVVTLRCMRAIVEFQAVARGRKVRLSGDGRQVLQKYTPVELVDKKRADLLGMSLRSEKLSTNSFGTKLVASSSTIMPLSLQYDPMEPNSVRTWLARWSSSHFWEPISRPKKILDSKPKRKQAKLQHEETEPGRAKRSGRRVPAANLEGNLVNSSEKEKPKPTSRKVSSHQVESVQEQSHNELEKVKRSLRIISVSTVGSSEKPEIAIEKPPISLDKASESPNLDASEQGTNQSLEKGNDLNDGMTSSPKPEALPLSPPPPPAPLEEGKIKPEDVLQDDDHHHPGELPSLETNGKAENEPPVTNGKEHNFSKENLKTRRRKSFPVKQEHPPETVLHNTPTLPSYMAATESAKAKLRAQTLAKAAEDGTENGFVRRHSLPSSTGKPSLQSPRALQANAKGLTKHNKSQISARDDKTGWKR